jgi:hypothetical protein
LKAHNPIKSQLKKHISAQRLMLKLDGTSSMLRCFDTFGANIVNTTLKNTSKILFDYQTKE